MTPYAKQKFRYSLDIHINPFSVAGIDWEDDDDFDEDKERKRKHKKPASKDPFADEEMENEK